LFFFFFFGGFFILSFSFFGFAFYFCFIYFYFYFYNFLWNLYDLLISYLSYILKELHCSVKWGEIYNLGMKILHKTKII
jgi:hypothetical protein